MWHYMNEKLRSKCYFYDKVMTRNNLVNKNNWIHRMFEKDIQFLGISKSVYWYFNNMVFNWSWLWYILQYFYNFLGVGKRFPSGAFCLCFLQWKLDWKSICLDRRSSLLHSMLWTKLYPQLFILSKQNRTGFQRYVVQRYALAWGKIKINSNKMHMTMKHYLFY